MNKNKKWRVFEAENKESGYVSVSVSRGERLVLELEMMSDGESITLSRLRRVDADRPALGFDKELLASIALKDG